MSATARPAVVVAGGGTGGHLFPGLATAEVLRARGIDVTFVGTAAGIEARAVPAAGFPLRLIPGQQLRGGGVRRAVTGVVAAARGVAAASAVLATLRPRLVVGVGGYASVAMVLAARLRRIPTVLLEQNAVPGAANRFLGRLGPRVCVGFAEAISFFPTGRAVHTGNPIRAAVLAVPVVPHGDRLGLLVFGGSQGARRLNQATVEAMTLLGPRAAAFALTHQTGTADHPDVVARYAALGLDARVEAFVADMGAAYAAADLVVARAGAMSCAEITAVGLPAVLVPYPYAADDHQRRNAEVLVAAGAAQLILDRDLTGARLAAVLDGLAGDPTRRAAMRDRARAIGVPDAAERVATVCEQALRPATLEARFMVL